SRPVALTSMVTSSRRRDDARPSVRFIFTSSHRTFELSGGVFLHSVPIDPEVFGNSIGRFACRDSLRGLLSQLVCNARPTDAFALRPGSSHPGSGALGYLLRFELGQRG